MAADKIKQLVALLKKMPKTDRGYSWELRDAYGMEAIRAYGANAATFKFILDHTDDLIALLSEAETREREARAKALGDAAEAIFVMGAWSPNYEKLTQNTFDEGTSAAYEIVRELQGKAESALQSEAK